MKAKMGSPKRPFLKVKQTKSPDQSEELQLVKESLNQLGLIRSIGTVDDLREKAKQIHIRLGKFIENSHERTLQAKSSNYGDILQKQTELIISQLDSQPRARHLDNFKKSPKHNKVLPRICSSPNKLCPSMQQRITFSPQIIKQRQQLTAYRFISLSSDNIRSKKPRKTVSCKSKRNNFLYPISPERKKLQDELASINRQISLQRKRALENCYQNKVNNTLSKNKSEKSYFNFQNERFPHDFSFSTSNHDIESIKENAPLLMGSLKKVSKNSKQSKLLFSKTLGNSEKWLSHNSSGSNWHSAQTKNDELNISSPFFNKRVI